MGSVAVAAAPFALVVVVVSPGHVVPRRSLGTRRLRVGPLDEREGGGGKDQAFYRQLPFLPMLLEDERMNLPCPSGLSVSTEDRL